MLQASGDAGANNSGQGLEIRTTAAPVHQPAVDPASGEKSERTAHQHNRFEF